MRALLPGALRPVATAAVVSVLLAACTASSPPSITPTAGPSSTPSPAASVEPTPLAAWQFDADGDGSPGEPLTFVGTHEFDHGAVVLDGVTGYGATPGAGPLDTTASFTVAAWTTVSEKTPFASVLSQVGETAAAFYLGFGEGAWAFSMKDLDTNEGTHTIRAMATRPVVIDPAAWVHIAGVFDQPAGTIRLYLDGEPVAETPFNAPWGARGSLVVGGSQTRAVPSDFWPGAIDAATVYQAALTGEEIGHLRDASRPTALAPILAPPSADPAFAVLGGTWDYAVTEADSKEFRDLMAEAAEPAGKPGAKVALRFGFDRERWWQGFVLDGELWLLHGIPEGDGGVMTVDGDNLTLTNGRDGWLTYHWAADHDGLTLALVDCVTQDRSGDCPDEDVVNLLTSRTFTRSGTDPSY